MKAHLLSVERYYWRTAVRAEARER